MQYTTNGRMTLDGMWQIAFDRENEGLEKNWHRPGQFPEHEAPEIPVPSCWEEHEEDYEGVAWYTREIAIPADWQGQVVRLRFGAVNAHAEVWLNGDMVGGKTSGYTPIEFDVTQLLRCGQQNRLVVRVVGPAVRSERVGHYVSNETAHWRGGYVGGIWQSVSLIATGPVFVRDIFVEPCLSRSEAVVNIELSNDAFQPLPKPGEMQSTGGRRGPQALNPITSRRVTMAVTISPADAPTETVASTTVELVVPPGGMSQRHPLKLDRVVPWSPESPHLYRATVRLLDDRQELHSESIRFGMREFTLSGTDFVLNGERVFIKGAFWEGLYPGTMAHPRNAEIVRREIRLAKEAGFNLLRPWRMPPCPLILDLADEMGMLLVGSPAIACMGYWPAETPRMEEVWTQALTEMVRRDRNHASIIMWENTNEIVRKSMLVRRHRVSLAARAVDPTRVILDESGGARAPWGAFVYPPYSTEPTPIDDRHTYVGAPVASHVYDKLASYGADSQPVFVSEVGCGSFPEIAENCARYQREGNPNTPDFRYHHELLASLEAVMAENDLYPLFPDVSALCRSTQEIQALANCQQLEALRINPKAGGYCIHAYTDGDWVVGAGVLDIWRNPKLLYGTLKELQRPLHLAVRVEPTNVYASRGATLTVIAANDGKPVRGDLVVTVANTAGQELWSETRPVNIPRRVTPLLDTRLDTASWAGPCRATARLIKEDEVLAETSIEFLVFADAEATPSLAGVTILDADGQLQGFLAGKGVPTRGFETGEPEHGPVLVAPSDTGNESRVGQFVRLLDWVERGGVAVWLDAPGTFEFHGQPIYRDPENNFLMRFLHKQRRTLEVRPNFLIASGVLPFDLKHRPATGLWIPVGHYGRKHEAFAGLPVDGFMSGPWRNVVARRTLLNLPGPAIGGCVSWDSYHDYHAKTECWHGTDLGTVSHGKGTMIFSTLNILQHLGKDPIADRMLGNLADFAVSLQNDVDPPTTDLAPVTAARLADFRRVRDEWNAKVEAAASEPWE